MIKESLESKIIGFRIGNFIIDEKILAKDFFAPVYIYNKNQLEKFNRKIPNNKNIINLAPETWSSWNPPTILKQQFKQTMEALSK